MKIFAIVVAGGKGSRMGSDVPKQYMEINGKPLLYYTLRAFEEAGDLAGECAAGACAIDGVSVVVAQDRMQYVVSEIVDAYRLSKVIRVCEGGAERYESVYHALDDLSDIAKDDDIVLIQDGARPFVTPELIGDIAEGVRKYGAAVAAVKAKDTIKITDADGFVTATTNRAQTWQIQTPQGFRYGEILAAYRTLFARGIPDPRIVTDDSYVFETAFPEKKVKLIEAFYGNIKITTMDDLEVAKEKLK